VRRRLQPWLVDTIGINHLWQAAAAGVRTDRIRKLELSLRGSRPGRRLPVAAPIGSLRS